MTSPFEELRFCDSASILLDHWFSIKTDTHICPLKIDFSPMRMGVALPDIFLAEQHSENYTELRVVGSNTREITGGDKTKANMYDICKPSHVDTVKQLYSKLSTGTVAAISEHMIYNKYGRRLAKVLHLPLCNKAGEVRYVVGVAKALPITKFHQDTIIKAASTQNGISISYTQLNAA